MTQKKIEQDIKKCHQLIHDLYKKLYELKDSNDNKEALCEQIEKVENQYEELQNKRLHFIEAIENNDKLELKPRGKVDRLINTYAIILKDIDIPIGRIEYRGYHSSNYLGDIGVVIDSQYRGNHYGEQSLDLLSDYLYKHDIKDFWYTAYDYNEASIKMIQKHNGKIIKKIDDNGLLLYEAKTKEYIDINQKSR